jgi:carbamoyltransferase
LGHRSLLADPRSVTNTEKLNDIKGREQFRPVAPMVLAERADEIFDGPMPSPYMLFTHRVRDGWASASPPSCTSTARPGSRPSTARRSR